VEPLCTLLRNNEMNNLNILSDQVQRQLILAGVNIRALGAGCFRLKGHRDSLVVTSDFLNLRANEIAQLFGGAA
jgi:hypothetical protein